MMPAVDSHRYFPDRLRGWRPRRRADRFGVEKTKTADATREFLSIAIDDPTFKTRMNIAAFKNREGGYDLTWSRPELKTAS
jgi:uncharacterized protein (DUF736 family)